VRAFGIGVRASTSRLPDVYQQDPILGAEPAGDSATPLCVAVSHVKVITTVR
jgi:hypothetical protein